MESNSKRKAGRRLGAAPLLGHWTLWSDKPPKEPGIYWLAGYFPADDDGDASTEPEEPIVWEINDDNISGKYSIQYVHGYAPENLVWCGPLIAPGFGPNDPSSATRGEAGEKQ